MYFSYQSTKGLVYPNAYGKTHSRGRAQRAEEAAAAEAVAVVGWQVHWHSFGEGSKALFPWTPAAIISPENKWGRSCSCSQALCLRENGPGPELRSGQVSRRDGAARSHVKAHASSPKRASVAQG